MLTLCIDTAYKYLSVCLIKDDKIIASSSEECFKRQSEEVFVALDRIFNEANINPKQIDSICISKGPGSYTGVRIAMTIAKVIGEVLNIDVYTISTLKLYAANKPNTMVIMNARADRAYIGIYDEGKTIMDDCILTIDQIFASKYNVVGDGSLVNKEDNFINICEAFLNTKSNWQKVDNIAYLVPEYLKESESYYR